ncbi:hypothetical protein ABW19_dt0202809 [Dactylella cylindrospora]|nr:hypothetical protein ABW19_dt0202809 [Dactylella cylindrospora]
MSTTSVGSPTCIFTPSSTTDVAKAVKLFSDNSCIFAIRSGGHLPNPGFSSTNNGILVSLSGLNQVNYDASSGVVDVGTGNRWKKVYETLDAEGITVMGGRSADVGVGGFLLGGGFSYLSNANGWGVDNVVSFEVVLADGSIVNANAQEHSDLFQALKGGSSNFGIVTTFTMTAYNVSAITAGLVIYLEPSTPQLLDAAFNYVSSSADVDPKSHVIPAWVKFGILPVLPSFTVFYSEQFDVKNPPPVVKPFIDGSIPYLSNGVSNQKGVTGMANQLGIGQPNGLRNQWQDCTVVADAALFKTIYSLWSTDAKPYETTLGFMNNISIQPIGKTFIKAGQDKGGNSMGITSPIVNISVNVVWALPIDDARMKKYLDTLFQHIKDAAKKAGKYSEFQYLNYAGPGQDPIASYGAESVARLAEAKKKYDPDNVFGTLVEGGFKIPGF